MTQINKVLSNKQDNKESNNIEIADILRRHIADYQKKFPLQAAQYKIVYDLLNCRTEYLGGHIERCDHCDTERIAYNSCRNRHCPKCQNMPRERWLEERKYELLPVIYFHPVFTLPHDLNPIILFNKKVMLSILFRSVAETLLAFGKNPQNGLGGKLGLIAILHTWDQLLNPHFHLHCLVPGGAIAEDREKPERASTRWIPCKNEYLFNEEALGIVFRGKFIDEMTRAYDKGELIFPGISAPFEKPEKFRQLKDMLYAKKWVVNIKEPITRPEYVLEYLGRYTHRVAISNHRIVALKDGKVTFKYKNRQTNQMEETTIEAVEFIRRFLLHALPKGFVRIRHYGFLTNRNKTETLRKIHGLFGRFDSIQSLKKTVEEMMLKLTGIDITLCPCCKKGNMRVIAEIPERTGLCPARIIRPDPFPETG